MPQGLGVSVECGGAADVIKLQPMGRYSQNGNVRAQGRCFVSYL